MQKINLKKAIKDSGLNNSEIAKQLFPKNKYPSLALNRVIQGKAFLDSAQISKLSLLLNISISDLFGATWKSKKVGHIMTLTTGNYKAELDTQLWITKIFDKDSLFHESVIHNGSVGLSIYLSALNTIILEHKTKKVK